MADPDEISQKCPRRRRKKKKKRQRDEIARIPGVRKIILSELTQKIISCTVGEDISSENPWKFVKKELVQDNIELHEESSEFLPIRKEIIQYPREELLIGYIADDTQDRDDEFYICVTEEATEAVEKIIDRLKQEQEYRLYHQLYKDIQPWQSQGSEIEVDESIITNNRPLLEVEVETQYPIFPGRVQFRIVKSEQRRDGYMELRCSPEENLVNVYMRRIDSSVQVAPQVISAEAQTICTYPKNTATQYLYDVGNTDELLAKCQTKIVDFATENFENLSDLLRVNGSINFYANDYESLVLDQSTRVGIAIAREFIEYMFFMDVNLCKGKMISDICWHPMWTGTVAIAYSKVASNIYNNGPIKEDLVYHQVHDPNLVLIWCFNEGLRPKLILESPREIFRLSFCKFDENILIGGCRNGQVVLWDIRNKLQKVEEKEVLTTAQQKYRSYMHSLMGWMKDTHDISVVRPAAVSAMRYSHLAAVTAIMWMDPFYEYSRTGNLVDINADEEEQAEKHSMQFLTSGIDGFLMIWDLLKKPTIGTSAYKPKKLRRLKKRPSALQLDMSPYKALHMNLKPIYKISICKFKQNKFSAITSASSGFCRLNYVEPNPEKTRKYDMTERIIYNPVMKPLRPFDEMKPVIKIGTIEGDYAEVYWEGQDFDSGEIVNSEQGKYLHSAKYHDGPINSIKTSPSNQATLTVGGKIFCLWRKELPDRPVIWRRSRHMFTKGEWSIFQTFKIILHSLSGETQKWALSINSKAPIFQQIISTSYVTSAGMHPFRREKNIYGVGDELGAFRLFYLPVPLVDNLSRETDNMTAFIDREVARKQQFLKWQDDFNKRNEGYLLRKKQDEEQRAKDDAKRETQKDDEKVLEKHVRRGPQPGKYVEWIKEQRQIKEEARIKAMIISKKQLDTKELEKRRKPLQKLDEENERKKRKQKERLKEGETIFKETVASLFPDVMKERPVTPPDPYAGGNINEEMRSCYQQFEEGCAESEVFISDNPFKYDFSFKQLLIQTKKKHADGIMAHKHAMRYDKIKRIRRGEEESIDSEAEDLEAREDPVLNENEEEIGDQILDEMIAN